MECFRRLLKPLFLVLCLFFIGCKSVQDLPTTDFQCFIETDNSIDNLSWASMVTMPLSKIQLNICSQPIFFASDIDNVRVSNSYLGKCLMFKLTQHAAIHFYKLSVESIGRKIILVKDGQALGMSTPIKETSLDGSFFIFLEVQEDELDKIASEFNDTILKLKKLKGN